MMPSELSKLEIWESLMRGKSLVGLRAEMWNGRVDLRQFDLPDPRIISRFRFSSTRIERLETVAIQGGKWRNLDFTGGKLNELRLMDCEIENCIFDGCELKGARIWASTFRDSSFRGADLSGSVLGGVKEGVRNVFAGVDFSDSNLTGTIYQAAAFERCLFRGAKLVKIDFQTTTFTDCRFEGELDDVLFYYRGFGGDKYPPNEMVNVDFSKARLRHVGFRGLTLDRVRLPHDDDHIVLRDFARTLDEMRLTLGLTGDALSKKLVAFVGVRRKWATPNQVQGYISLPDLAAVVGEEGIKRFIAAIPKSALIDF
jgi:uncharacterized protein YjbI with pentapeptide repeats